MERPPLTFEKSTNLTLIFRMYSYSEGSDQTAEPSKSMVVKIEKFYAVLDICITHYNDVIMDAMASQITSLIIVYSIVYSGTDKRKHQSSTSLAFVRGIHRWPVNSPHKRPVTRKMFPFDDVIMLQRKDHQVDRLIISLCFKCSEYNCFLHIMWRSDNGNKRHLRSNDWQMIP